MSISNIMLNFQAILKVSLPYLLKVGVTIDSDEWDDYVETSFAAAVTAPIREAKMLNIKWKYGFWPVNFRAGPIIVKVPRPEYPILLGRAEAKGQEIAVTYSEETIEEEYLKFSFREFSNPFLGDSENCLEWVLGEVNDWGLEGPERANICVPLHLCEFLLD